MVKGLQRRGRRPAAKASEDDDDGDDGDDHDDANDDGASSGIEGSRVGGRALMTAGENCIFFVIQ